MIQSLRYLALHFRRGMGFKCNWIRKEKISLYLTKYEADFCTLDENKIQNKKLEMEEIF